MSIFTGMLDDAMALCISAHRGQLDKCGEPYAMHPIRVGLAVPSDAQFRDTLRVIGFLHDTVEDTEVTVDMISKQFGELVGRTVETLTRLKGEDYLGSFIPRIRESKLATDVKILDILDNLDPTRRFVITQRDLDRREKYYRALLLLRGW